MDKTDEELVVLIQKGDILAFEILVKRYQNRLLGFTWRITRDRQLAEEVVQDSLFKVYKSIDKVDTSRKFSTLLYEIAKNGAISELRKTKKNLPLESFADLADDSDLINQAENRDLIENALNKINPKYQKVIRLYYFDSLSYKEIQANLNIPLNTVRTYLRRGKEELKIHLQNEKV